MTAGQERPSTDARQQTRLTHVESTDPLFNVLKMRAITGARDSLDKHIFIDFCVVIALCEIVFG